MITILELGGNPGRLDTAVSLLQSNPGSHLVISSESPASVVLDKLTTAGVTPDQYTYDETAWDTVTNFTTLVNDLASAGIRHLYLITSDYHMARARAIATLVLGSRSITFTPVSIPTPNAMPESPLRILRDTGRSILWLTTGRTGASFDPRYS